jgi:hypothetical protein
MPPGLRKLVLTAHLTCSVGWIGAVVAYLVLGVTAAGRDAATARAAWIGMEVVGWWAIAPLALTALLTGLAISLATPWGLFRHYWVLLSLGLTGFAAAVLLLHLPAVSAGAAAARAADGAPPRGLGGDLPHAGGGLLVLLVVAALNVYKPRGLTPYGWRKQQAERGRRPMRAPAPRSRAIEDAPDSRAGRRHHIAEPLGGADVGGRRPASPERVSALAQRDAPR